MFGVVIRFNTVYLLFLQKNIMCILLEIPEQDLSNGFYKIYFGANIKKVILNSIILSGGISLWFIYSGNFYFIADIGVMILKRVLQFLKLVMSFLLS